MRPVEARDLLRSGLLFFNRFEDVVYDQFPELRQIYDTLRGERFVKVLMSGSGSTVYGLCRGATEAEALAGALRERVDADIFAVASERAHSAWGGGADGGVVAEGARPEVDVPGGGLGERGG